MNIDPYILAFSAFTVAVTIWMGFRSARKSKTASDFFVAGRSVSVGWNASAISGEYLSAASFMGIAGMVMSSGYDALWYPVCYACGYLFLLLFIAGPLRRFGAYTIPDFAEGRFDSPVFRKIAVVFVLFIGFFYTMPQMKGAGVTLAYIFPGLPYWVGVVLVGAVITLNVALGGMKGITLVQAFQYWAKMFAISVPIFVLMAVYGHYGKQLSLTGPEPRKVPVKLAFDPRATPEEQRTNAAIFATEDWQGFLARAPLPAKAPADANWLNPFGPLTTKAAKTAAAAIGKKAAASVAPSAQINNYDLIIAAEKRGDMQLRQALTELQAIEAANRPTPIDPSVPQAKSVLPLQQRVALAVRKMLADTRVQVSYRNASVKEVLGSASEWVEKPIFLERGNSSDTATFSVTNVFPDEAFAQLKVFLTKRNLVAVEGSAEFVVVNQSTLDQLRSEAAKTAATAIGKKAEKLSREVGEGGEGRNNSSPTSPPSLPSRDLIPLRPGLSPDQRMTVALDSPTVAQALGVYAELTGRQLLPNTNSLPARVDDLLGGKLSALKLITRPPAPVSGVREHGDGMFTAAEVKAAIERQLSTNGVALVAVGEKEFRVEPESQRARKPEGQTPSSTSVAQSPTDSLALSAEKAWLAKHEKPLALLYTYSLIIAIVCGTAGLPHILVRFYTNPDGGAAKRTTMWVMILIGVFYVFPPVFGALGRNLMPDLYTGLAGIKGTDQVVLKLPVLLNEKYPPLGSILSGITCAGAFAAFMSTFSGLLVSMTGALAHDVYGRILRPKSTPEQRMRMFKIGAVLIGGVAVLLGSFVEPLEINFMVGQAFAIAAASYFPLLFMAVWWRKLTMKGAAVGMLAGGVCALAAATLTNFSNLALDKGPMGKLFAGFAPLNDYWADHPLLRILCEQPAIWAVPLALTLMVLVSKLTAKSIPEDIRMKMLVLHAPEELGLKQEYIQEHSAPPGH